MKKIKYEKLILSGTLKGLIVPVELNVSSTQGFYDGKRFKSVEGNSCMMKNVSVVDENNQCGSCREQTYCPNKGYGKKNCTDYV
jgi:hypothetical protein